MLLTQCALAIYVRVIESITRQWLFIFSVPTIETDKKETSIFRQLFEVKMENFVHMQSTRTGRKYLRVIYIIVD